MINTKVGPLRQSKQAKRGLGMSFSCDITTILKLLMNIIEIVVNYYNLYDY
jgi:hypothetical protein